MFWDCASILNRFWSKVDKCDDDSCWMWKAGLSGPSGYGAFWVNDRGYSDGAHRVSWEIRHRQRVPDGLFVCHTCDTKLCVNPKHLFLGTLQVNNQDSVNKDRRSKGETRPAHRLTGVMASTIRERYLGCNCSYRQLASEYHVTPNTIGQLIRKETWKWL